MVNLNNLIRLFYVALFVIAPVLSYKVMDLFGVVMPVGSFIVVVLMLGLIDVINYRLGMKEAQRMILESLIIKIVIYLIIIPIAIHLPHAEFWKGEAIYESFLQESLKMFIMSEIVVFLGQYLLDVRIFHIFKRFNWFYRVIASDLVSQAIQTIGITGIKLLGTDSAIVKPIILAYLFSIGLSIIKAVILYPLAKVKEGEKHENHYTK